MSRYRDLPPDERRRLEAAAALQLRLEEGVLPDAEQQGWLSDTRNREAFEAVEEAHRTVDDLATSPQLIEMRRAALERVQRAAAAQQKPRRASSRLIAAALVCLAIAAGTSYGVLSRLGTYETDVGERRLVSLADSSRISMDADTELHVDYSAAARAITLDHGRARFDVSHDPSRPFTVTAGGQTVVAIGTSFDVERLDSAVLVTLLQGEVVIKNAAPAPAAAEPAEHRPPVSLSAGEQLVASAGAKPVVAPANLQTASAWEAGHLVFKDEPLDRALARVNRYTAHPVQVDAAAAGIRISGVFNAGDVSAFVSAVTSYFPVEATTTSDNAIQLHHRS